MGTPGLKLPGERMVQAEAWRGARPRMEPKWGQQWQAEERRHRGESQECIAQSQAGRRGRKAQLGLGGGAGVQKIEFPGVKMVPPGKAEDLVEPSGCVELSSCPKKCLGQG